MAANLPFTGALLMRHIISSLQNWHAIISSSLASLLLLGISTLIAIALVIHTELVPKKYLQIGSKPPTPTKQAASKRRESLSNITQISSAQSPEANGSSRSRSRSQSRNHPPPSRGRSAAGSSLPLSSGSAGIRGAIGISWLLPLLFAIAAPLICSIIGKWPRHWWPELVWTGGRQQTAADAASTDGDAGEEYGEDGGVYYATHSLLNADNLLLESEALLGNATGRRQAAPTLAEPSANALATSASSITVGSESNLAAVTAAALTWPQQQLQQEEKQPSVGWITPGHAAAFTSGTSATPSPSPSLSFILFVCIDLLFILLFCALFVILMKKLLWLWHKNRNVHAHPLDKFNMALRRR